MGTRLHESVSVDQSVSAMVDRLQSAVDRKERLPQRKELIDLIESGKHVLIGAKALAHHTKPRFTEDTDYIVSGQTFQRIKKWMRDEKVEHEDLGLVIRFHQLAVDVIDARSNAVLKKILKQEKSPPSSEALAAAKYIAFNPHRRQRRIQDVANFAELVTLEKFDVQKCRTFFVDEYANQWPEVEKLIADIKAGKSITI